MTDNIAIKLENISKTFTIRDNIPGNIFKKSYGFIRGNNIRKIKALNNINIEVKKGEFLGILGANGSGKSTLIHLMTGVYKPDIGGKANIYGNFIRLSLGLGFNSSLTTRENIYLNASIIGIRKSDIDKRFNGIIEFADLHNFVDTKTKYLSRGMKARLSFAIAVYADADIFLMDEFFGGVGDEKFKNKSEKIFNEAFIRGRTIVHVSHNLRTIKDYADRVMVLHKGECIGIGTPDEMFVVYRNILKLKKLKLSD